MATRRITLSTSDWTQLSEANVELIVTREDGSVAWRMDAGKPDAADTLGHPLTDLTPLTGTTRLPVWGRAVTAEGGATTVIVSTGPAA